MKRVLLSLNWMIGSYRLEGGTRTKEGKTEIGVAYKVRRFCGRSFVLNPGLTEGTLTKLKFRGDRS